MRLSVLEIHEMCVGKAIICSVWESDDMLCLWRVMNMLIVGEWWDVQLWRVRRCSVVESDEKALVGVGRCSALEGGKKCEMSIVREWWDVQFCRLMRRSDHLGWWDAQLWKVMCSWIVESEGMFIVGGPWHAHVLRATRCSVLDVDKMFSFFAEKWCNVPCGGMTKCSVLENGQMFNCLKVTRCSAFLFYFRAVRCSVLESDEMLSVCGWWFVKFLSVTRYSMCEGHELLSCAERWLVQFWGKMIRCSLWESSEMFTGWNWWYA